MVISIRGTAQGGAALNGQDVTLTFDVALQQNDVVILWGGHSHAAAGDVTPAVGPSTAGYTAITVFDDPTNAEPSFGVWYKVMGATPDATVVCQGNGTGTDSTAYGCVALYGQDLTTLQDATATTAGPTSSTNPDGPAITTVTDNAWIITTAGSQTNDTSRGSVSGYTTLAGGTANDTRPFSTDAAYLVKSPTGVDDPAAWSTWNTGVWYTVTVAIRPAVGGQQFTVTASDGLYVFDGAAKIVERVLVDRILTGDAQSRTGELLRVDQIILSDTALIQAVRQLLITDQILVTDSRVSQIDKTIVDTVFLLDTVVKTIEKIVRDGLYLFDSVTAALEVLGQVFTVSVTDGLYLLDRALRTEERVFRDSLFLSDQALRELLRQLTDRLLVSDTRQSVVELTFQDQMLVSDVSSRLRELLIRDGLYISDDVTRTLIEGLIEALIYARLRALDLLGMGFDSRDLLARVVKDADLLGRTVASDAVLGRRIGFGDLLGRLIGWGERTRILH